MESQIHSHRAGRISVSNLTFRQTVSSADQCRTEWAGRSALFGSNKMEEYSHMNAMAWAKDRTGQEDGDPVKGSSAIYQLGMMENPPLRAVLGSEALVGVLGKIEEYRTLFGDEKLVALAKSCDSPPPAPSNT